jgi:hypothetical protein
MSESKETSGQPDQKASGENQEGANLVSYDTHRKLLGEKKALQAKLAEFEMREKEKEQELLAEQGKWKELAEEKGKKLSESEKKYNEALKTFGRQVFVKEAKAVALQLGADPQGVDDLIKVGDWSSVEIGDDFKVNEQQLKESIARMQKEKPLFFKKQVSAPKDVNASADLMLEGKDSDKINYELELLKLGGKMFE